MTKKIFSVILLTAFISLGLNAQEEKQEKRGKLLGFPYGYIGLGYESPAMFGDMYSITNEHFYMGHGLNLRLGYRFSSIFGLELKAGYSMMKAGASPYQDKFWLGVNAMTYYDYTKIDGTEYTNGFVPKGDDDAFFGVWEKNNIGIAAKRYKSVYVRSNQIQVGLLGVINLNRIFMKVPEREEQRVSLLFKPGVYVNHYTARAYTKDGDKEFSEKITTPINVGLGGDLAMHVAMTRHFAFELSGGVMWVSNQEFDGIRTLKRAKDDYICNLGAALLWKFGKSPIIEDAPSPLEYKPLQRAFVFSPIVPDLGVIKTKEIAERAMFTFKLCKWGLLPYMGSNQYYLDRIDRTYRKLQADKDITLRSITVEGYASPEGPHDFNIELGINRANAIAKYLVRHYNFPEAIISTNGNAEDWKGLEEALVMWDHAGKEKMLRIVRSNIDPERKKEQLKACGAVYRAALQEIYPPLRHNECVFKFDIKAYEKKDLAGIFATSPEKLSADELIALANNHVFYSPNFISVVNKAYSLYPSSTKVAAYKAATLLRNKHNKEAMDILQSVEKTDYILSLVGVAHLQMGNEGKAREHFQKAADMGNEDARVNVQIFDL